MTVTPYIKAARQGYFQNEQVLGRQGIPYDNVALAAGTLKIGKLPANCLITRTIVNITTAFAATTTNVLTVGTVSGTANTIVTAGDVNETVAALTSVAGVGTLSTSAALNVFAKFTGAGAANTAGVADILVFYVDMGNL